MKLGIRLKINVNEIQKDKLFEGKKGKYLNLVTFVDIDTKDEYNNNGFVTQNGDKDEKMPILGNAQVFWKDTNHKVNESVNSFNSTPTNSDDEIPF